MKKFTKIALILAVVLFSVGLVSVIGSFAMGLTWDSLGDMVDKGKFSFDFSNADEQLYFDINQEQIWCKTTCSPQRRRTMDSTQFKKIFIA